MSFITISLPGLRMFAQRAEPVEKQFLLHYVHLPSLLNIRRRILWAVSLRHHMYTGQANGIIHLSVFVEQQSQEFVGQQIKS